MVVLSLLLLSCRATEVQAPEAPPPPLAESAVMVRTELGAAHRQWADGNRAEASAAVLKAYATWFQPIEPALAARDPVATLQMEYAFGRLAAHAARRGDPVALVEQIRDLTDRIDGAVAAAESQP